MVGKGEGCEVFFWDGVGVGVGGRRCPSAQMRTIARSLKIPSRIMIRFFLELILSKDLRSWMMVSRWNVIRTLHEASDRGARFQPERVVAR